jgi:hypothetical protein
MKMKKMTDETFERVQAGAFATVHKRGKVTPTAKASWGAKSGDGEDHDPTEAARVLGEALGN